MRPIRRWIIEQAAAGGVTTRDVVDQWGIGLGSAASKMQKAKADGLIMPGDPIGFHNARIWVATPAGREWLEGSFAANGARQPEAEGITVSLADSPDLPDDPPEHGYGSGKIELEMLWWRPASLQP